MDAPATASQPSSRSGLIGRLLDELEAVMAEMHVPPPQVRMRARQLWHWLYHQGAAEWDAMTTLPGRLRTDLAERFHVDRAEVTRRQLSSDGTVKALIRLAEGHTVESVYIPEPDRGTLCISTQVGCSLSCTFCHTGTMALVRNLKAGEILQQILLTRDALNEWPTPHGPRRLSHIVVMGMGEPLLNYDETKKALLIVMAKDGLAFPKGKITLSTAGIVPKIDLMGRDLGVNLAVSLHAVRDDLRDELVPINRKWQIAELLEACRRYAAPQRRVTFEYVMLDGVNDGAADAKELARLLAGMSARVNLIPFNPWPGAPYRCSPEHRIRAFSEIVSHAGHPAPIRRPRGSDILAACGQLKTASERRRRIAA